MDLPETGKLIGDELLSLLGAGRQIRTYSERYAGFSLADAYKIVARVRDLRIGRGETPVGRKIGFTNRSIWGEHGISAPIWNYVFDQTVTASGRKPGAVELRGMPEPRIEPEVVLHLSAAPQPGMSVSELANCVDRAAPGFEVVYSVFPNWDFTAADAAAAFGVHGALFVGEWLELADAAVDRALRQADFSVALEGGDGVRRDGHATNVLGGPLEALRFLVEELARFPGCEPLRPGEIITTGTLTEAMPMRAGESWSARFEGIAFGPMRFNVA